MEKQELYKQAVKLWGTDAQLGMLQEEAAEVIVQVNKVRRGSHPFGLMEELADLEIMIEQIKGILKCDDKVAELKIKKLEKLKRYIDNSNPSNSDCQSV